MSKKKKTKYKKHNNKLKTYFYSSSKSSFASPKDIENIAFKVFGSTYYTTEL